MKTLTKYHYDGDITFEEGIILTEDLKVEGNLTVRGDIICEGGYYIITADDIIADNITARNINADDIIADDITANNITANNITADNIIAYSITAWDISYRAVCFAYQSFKCKSAKGRRENSKHFCLDSEIEFKNEEEKIIELSNGSKVSESTIKEALKFVAEHK